MSTETVGRMVTPEARVLYPYLLQLRTEAAGKKLSTPRYDAIFLFDPGSIEAMKQEAIKVARAKWPGRELSSLKFPFKKGDAINAKRVAKGSKPIEAMNGMIVLQAKAAERFPPQVVDSRGDPIIDKRQVYSGCYGYAEVKFEAYEVENAGVTVYINAFMKSRDGEKVGGRDMRQVFAGVIGKQTLEDPTEGLDDDIMS